ncbi:biopolymer transport protein ExbD [Panacagrimonas perspica]|uniref:Biopolymer transport protein ExbD n=1 Tax=Panacagrimonas perspica TaxID=381431 RepID=A0A4S3K862_9GAMM|nr:biopolymer transporter ExbD [Panacagrimonas perspica]TDU32026.1 biopolymer transport protein ExbD [Panacagrimonas perspica]THD04442.1 hypothetical protein B1810_05400 [Panacagrimonas perspica]
MSVRRARHKIQGTELQLTAFINPMVVLVTFLLVNVAFSHASVLDLRLPGPAAGSASAPTPAEKLLLLEVTVRQGSIEIGDRNRGSIAKIPNVGDAPDLGRLSAELIALKTQYPDENEASVLLDPDVSYDRLVQIMDVVRAQPMPAIFGEAPPELFPRIAIGDAAALAR